MIYICIYVYIHVHTYFFHTERLAQTLRRLEGGSRTAKHALSLPVRKSRREQTLPNEVKVAYGQTTLRVHKTLPFHKCPVHGCPKDDVTDR